MLFFFVGRQIPGVARIALKAVIAPLGAVLVMAAAAMLTGFMMTGLPFIVVLVAKILAGLVS